MGGFSWEFTPKAEKKFRKLDTTARKRILAWLETNIQDADNPRLLGESLEGDFQTLWKYRVGKYRIIADIQDGDFLVLVVKTGKREDVYKRGI